jgi:hypothetical protein
MLRLVGGHGRSFAHGVCRLAPRRTAIRGRSTAVSLLHSPPAMVVVARIAVMLCLALLAACGVAVASGSDDEAMVVAARPAGVHGKRAFDAAHSGYATFRPLVGESTHRTLMRASARIEELERDLAVMRRHHDARVGDELAGAASLLAAARVAIEAIERPHELDHARLVAIVALVDGAQRVLHGAREQRVRADV